jgi:hypothetical protein
MSYNTQNYWILENKKHDVSETICFRPQLSWGEDTKLRPLERALEKSNSDLHVKFKI